MSVHTGIVGLINYVAWSMVCLLQPEIGNRCAVRFLKKQSVCLSDTSPAALSFSVVIEVQLAVCGRS